MKIISKTFLNLVVSFLLATFNVVATSTESQEKPSWAISETLQNAIGAIPAADVVKALNTFGIQATLVHSQDYIQKYKILEGAYFSIYLAPRAFQKDQVWILTHPKTPSQFEDLNLDQLTELENFRYLIGDVFLNNLNYDGYVSFINAEKQYGLNRPVLCLEMLPAQYKGKNNDQVDILEKLEKVWYVLFDAGVKSFFTPLQTSQKINQIKNYLATLQQKGVSLSTQKRMIKNTLLWSRKLIHLQKLREYCLSEFQRELIKSEDFFLNNPMKNKEALPLTGSSHNEGEFTQVDEEALEIKTCAFCNPKVIKNQHVYSFGDFVGLYNFRPYILGYHFMIAPDEKHHIENWQDLSLDDCLKIDQLAQAFIKAIKEDSKRKDIVLFVQNGFAGGMTVPHSHLHILLKPSALRLITMNLIEVTGLEGEGIRLSPEEMRPIREKFNTLVGQFLNNR